jgi:hypothetical protein
VEFSFSAVNVGWRHVSPQGALLATASHVPRERHPSSHSLVHIAMITAANTPHTITNALMICFISETDIARRRSGSD